MNERIVLMFLKAINPVFMAPPGLFGIILIAEATVCRFIADLYFVRKIGTTSGKDSVIIASTFSVIYLIVGLISQNLQAAMPRGIFLILYGLLAAIINYVWLCQVQIVLCKRFWSVQKYPPKYFVFSSLLASACASLLVSLLHLR